MRLDRRNCARLTLAALLGFSPFVTYAGVTPRSIVVAVNANNVKVLEVLSKSAPTAQQRALSAGALLALHNEDQKALAVLVPVTRSTASAAVRAAAYFVLSNVYKREQRYGACYSALRNASDLSPKSAHPDYRQTMKICQTLAGVKPMRLVKMTPGSLPITGQAVGIIRVPSKIDSHRCGVMLDTGAAFSTISASVAKRVGIHILSQSVNVGSSTEEAVEARLGVARRLQIGNAMFKNVVFIVLADSKLRFPHSFRVSAIIGLPVLMALGRLEFLNSDAPILRYGMPPGKVASQTPVHSNMLLSGLEPLVLVRIPGADSPLRMELDTGSDRTYFTHHAVAEVSALSAHAERYVWHVGGAGGVVTEHHALRLPQVTLTISGRPITLKNVLVSSRASSAKDGVIGNDIFRHGTQWTMDFKTMTLTVAN